MVSPWRAQRKSFGQLTVNPTYEYDDEENEFRSVKFQAGEVEINVVWSEGVISEITLST